MTKKSVLILCTGNSARSQMGEGLFRAAAGDTYDVYSAGTHPSVVRPEAVAVLAEIGIDISGQRSKSLDEFTGRGFTYVITVCDHAAELCPTFLSADRRGATQRLHWPFEDPAGPNEPEEVRFASFRKVRDRIKAKIADFLK